MHIMRSLVEYFPPEYELYWAQEWALFLEDWLQNGVSASHADFREDQIQGDQT